MTIECMRYTSVNKGSLLGYADFYVFKTGLEIQGCTLHQKEGRRCINFPSKEYTDSKTGEKKYSSIVRFRDKAHMELFTQKAKEAIEKKAAEQTQHHPEPSYDEEVPF